MGFFDNPIVRVGAGLATGGLSEVARAGIGATSKAPDQQAVGVEKVYYGGDEDYAQNRARFMAGEANDIYKDRPAEQVNFANANADYARSQQARNQLNNTYAGQSMMVDDYRRVIDGRAGPSLAEMQMQQGAQRNSQMAMQQAASMGGNQALAFRQAQQNAMLSGQQMNADAAMLRAQEVAKAREQLGQTWQSMGQTAHAMRDGDFKAREASQAQSMAQANLNLSYLQTNDAQNRYLNDQVAHVRDQELLANSSYSQSVLQAKLAAQGFNAQAAANAKANQTAIIGAAISGGAAVAAKKGGG